MNKPICLFLLILVASCSSNKKDEENPVLNLAEVTVSGLEPLSSRQLAIKSLARMSDGRLAAWEVTESELDFEPDVKLRHPAFLRNNRTDGC